MNPLASKFRAWLHKPIGKVMSSTWPITLLARKLDCAYEAQLARILIANTTELQKYLSVSTYAKITESSFKKQRKTTASLLADAIQLERANVGGLLTASEGLSRRYESLSREYHRALELDSAWLKRAARFRSSRAAIWEESLQWSQALQRRVARLIARVDEELARAQRASDPKQTLDQVEGTLNSIRGELVYASGARTLLVKTSGTAKRVDRISIAATHSLVQDRQSFEATFKAGQAAFDLGDYVATRRHMAAARELAQQILSADRQERREQMSEAREWVSILGDKEEWARDLGLNILKVINESGVGDFHLHWEELHRKIDDEILARACEMGNRDRRAIAERIGSRNVVKWGETMSWKDLTRFAQSVSDLL